MSKIIELGKVREFAMTDEQARDPKFDVDLGDQVTIKIVGRVTKSADAGENLFTFSRRFSVVPDYSFLDNVKKYEELEKEQAEADATIIDPVAEDRQKKSKKARG